MKHVTEAGQRDLDALGEEQLKDESSCCLTTIQNHKSTYICDLFDVEMLETGV